MSAPYNLFIRYLVQDLSHGSVTRILTFIFKNDTIYR